MYIHAFPLEVNDQVTVWEKQVYEATPEVIEMFHKDVLASVK
jgi:hypothetical protein